MREEELIEQAMNLPLVYCDNFGAFRKINGIFRAIGYVLEGGAVLNLAVSLPGAQESQMETARVLKSPHRAKCPTIWNGHDLAH